ncbi:hypothetical protein ACLBX9_06965 [Methylobacterium sp. A49B]|nr:hypothetical protein [Actinomycetospora chiangmaiensis]
MRRFNDRTARRRAVIAVTALYALLLQAFLIAVYPAAPLAGTDRVICAEHGGGVPADDGSPPCRQHPCCILAQVAQPLAQPPSAPAEEPARPRRMTALPWRPTAPLGPRAPPDPAVSSRGPPTA